MKELSKAEQKEYELWLELRKRIRTSTAIDTNEAATEKAARIRRLIRSGNEAEFVRYYFPHYVSGPFAWFHENAFDDISTYNAFCVWEWAREHAKSVFANVFAPALRMARGELTGFILGSENESKACTLIADFQAELEDNVRLRGDYFPDGSAHVMGSWLSGHYMFGDGIGVWGFGIGQNPAGVRKAEKRPNLGVIDDADSKKKYAKNAVRLQEDLDWCLGEFLGCLSITGKLFIFANNRVTKAGLTAHMVGDVEEGDPKREGIRHTKVYATEHPITHEKLMPDEGGVPAWPRYTIEQLLQRMAEMGWRNTLRQFYHTHLEDGTVFAEVDLPWVELPDLDEYEQLLTYCDPSWKEGKKNDFKGIVLLGRKGRHIDIIDCWLRQGSRRDMVAAHYDIHETALAELTALRTAKGNTQPSKVVAHWMEANFMQDLILDEYYEEGRQRGYSLRIRGDERAKPDKFGRIEDLQPLASRGYIRFNAARKKNPDMRNLRDQFLAFPQGHDDGPDCVEGGTWLLQRIERTKRFGIHIEQRRPRYNNF